MRSREGVLIMGSINKRFKKNKNIEILLSVRFVCNNCNFSKIIPKEVTDNINRNEFKNNPIFICPNCNIRMVPTEIHADF